MLETYIPGNVDPILTTGVGALMVALVAIFIVRKIVEIVVISALIFGGWLVWNDPVLLTHS